MLRSTVGFVLGLGAVAAMAEENCHPVLRTATRFSGTVRSVEQLGRRELTVIPVEREPLFAVSIAIESVDGEPPLLRRGETAHFAVHSRSRMFRVSDAVGKAFHLEAIALSCGGVFRRFESLRVRGDDVEEFAGSLEVGATYRAAVRRDGDDDLTPITPLDLPMHHSGRIDWTNVRGFPQLGSDDRARTIVFEVVSKRIWQVAGQHQWRTLYEARIGSFSNRFDP